MLKAHVRGSFGGKGWKEKGVYRTGSREHTHSIAQTYVYVCVCVYIFCVYILKERERERKTER